MTTLADIATTMLPIVKVSDRAILEAFEPEVQANIAAALADMKRVGIAETCFDASSDYYPLVLQAVIDYSKAKFGQDNPNDEMRIWMACYQQTVTDLINSGANKYAAEDGDGE